MQAKKSLYRVRPVALAVKATWAEYARRVEEQRWAAVEDEEAQWLTEVNSIAIRPMLSEAIATTAHGDLHEGLYGLAVAFGFASDQRKRPRLAREIYSRLSNVFDRLSLLTARSPRHHQYSYAAAE